MNWRVRLRSAFSHAPESAFRGPQLEPFLALKNNSRKRLTFIFNMEPTTEKLNSNDETLP